MTSLRDITTLVADGYHNAFTDLCHWQGQWYVAYRKAHSHDPATFGDIHVMRDDAQNVWRHCAVIDTGGDDRDPQFVIDDDRLGILFGTYAYVDIPLETYHPAMKERLQWSHMAWSKNGSLWGMPELSYRPYYWLWSMVKDPYRDSHYYAAAYHTGYSSDDQTLHLVTHVADSQKLRWYAQAPMLDRWGEQFNEPCLWVIDDDQMGCIARRETRPAVIGKSSRYTGDFDESFRVWYWDELNYMVHSPAVCQTTDGRVFVAGRSIGDELPRGVASKAFKYPKSYKWDHYYTTLWELIDFKRLDHCITVPSGGDCAYPGLAQAPDGSLVMSYYSRHEYIPGTFNGPVATNVYLARFDI